MERPTQEAYLTFLNSIESTDHPYEWVDQFTVSLSHILPEIDHATWMYNILSREHHTSELNHSNILITKNSGDLESGVSAIPHTLSGRIEYVIDLELQQMGRTRDDFHPPTSISLIEEAWLGTLILFRSRTSPPFSDAALDTLEQLRPFLTFVLKEFGLKYHAAHPGDTVFYDVIRSSTEELGLTPQEMRVLMFRLFGRSYKEIAEFLSISEATVRNHLTAIHRKAGVHNQNELFARFFAPRFGLFSSIGMAGDDSE